MSPKLLGRSMGRKRPQGTHEFHQPDEEDSTMRISLLAAYVAVSLSVSQAHATESFSYKVRDSKPTNEASIQTVSFDTIAGMDQDALKKVNAALMATSTAFGREAKQCGAAAQGHPWGYNLTFEKVLLSEKYLSVVFDKSTVCVGSPDIEKEARVFSLPTGNLVPSKTLFKRVFPSAKLSAGVSTNKELVDLDEEMVETMIDDSKAMLKTYDSRCEFYLKNSSYRIWMNGTKLILFPEFTQPESFCQKEYVIQSGD